VTRREGVLSIRVAIESMDEVAEHPAVVFEGNLLILRAAVGGGDSSVISARQPPGSRLLFPRAKRAI